YPAANVSLPVFVVCLYSRQSEPQRDLRPVCPSSGIGEVREIPPKKLGGTRFTNSRITKAPLVTVLDLLSTQSTIIRPLSIYFSVSFACALRQSPNSSPFVH